VNMDSKDMKISLVPRRQKHFYSLFLLCAVLLYAFSLFQLKLSYGSGLESIQKAFSFMIRMLTFNFTDWQDILYAALESISVAVLATIISSILAFLLGFIAATNVSTKGFPFVIKGLCAFVRAVPTLVWALIFVAYIGLGPFAGVLGLCIHSFAYLVKAFSQSIEEVNEGSLEAMKATGSSWLQTMAGGVVPTIKTSVISWTAMRFEINIAQSSILGLVGAGGIGHELSLYMRMFDFEKAGFVLLVIFFMSFAVEMTFNKLKINVDKLQK
jgi:phosphonate transport system permease protein